MKTEINGYLGGTFKGSFKDDAGKDVNYAKVLILDSKNSTEFTVASVDLNQVPLDKLKRFNNYIFSCDLKADGKTKVVGVYESGK